MFKVFLWLRYTYIYIYIQEARVPKLIQTQLKAKFFAIDKSDWAAKCMCKGSATRNFLEVLGNSRQARVNEVVLHATQNPYLGIERALITNEWTGGEESRRQDSLA